MSAAPNAIPSQPMPSAAPKRKKIMLTIGAVFAAAAVGYGLYWTLVSRYIEDTDNAYVQGNVVQITPQIAGTVAKIYADDTNMVKAGQPLVALDTADADVALAQAEAQLAQTVREVRTLYAAQAQAGANLAMREAELAKAKDDLARRKALAGSGAHVLLNGRDAATLEARVAEIEAAGGSASVLAFDVSDRAAVRDAFARIAREHGRLDVLVQNVGQRNRKPLADLTDDEIVTLLDVDLASSLILAREAARLMLPRGSGRLIAVTSVAGQISRANDSVYAAAKSGLNGMVRALAAEYGPMGLTSNAIAPGFFATETNAAITGDPERSAYFANRTPMGRWGRPEGSIPPVIPAGRAPARRAPRCGRAPGPRYTDA